MLPLRFVPYHRLDGMPNVIVDGSATAGTVLTLSHWPGSPTPVEARDDLSAQIALHALGHPGLVRRRRRGEQQPLRPGRPRRVLRARRPCRGTRPTPTCSSTSLRPATSPRSTPATAPAWRWPWPRSPTSRARRSTRPCSPASYADQCGALYLAMLDLLPGLLDDVGVVPGPVGRRGRPPRRRHRRARRRHRDDRGGAVRRPGRRHHPGGTRRRPAGPPLRPHRRPGLDRDRPPDGDQQRHVDAAHPARPRPALPLGAALRDVGDAHVPAGDAAARSAPDRRAPDRAGHRRRGSATAPAD